MASDGLVRRCVTVTQHSSLTAVVWVPREASERELREAVFAKTDGDDWEMDYGEVDTHELPEGVEDTWEHDSNGCQPRRSSHHLNGVPGLT